MTRAHGQAMTSVASPRYTQVGQSAPNSSGGTIMTSAAAAMAAGVYQTAKRSINGQSALWTPVPPRPYEVERKISDLNAMRRELSTVIAQCANNVIADCRIIEALSPRGTQPKGQQSHNRQS